MPVLPPTGNVVYLRILLASQFSALRAFHYIDLGSQTLRMTLRVRENIFGYFRLVAALAVFCMFLPKLGKCSSGLVHDHLDKSLWRLAAFL
jgi:hypothetical protein